MKRLECFSFRKKMNRGKIIKIEKIINKIEKIIGSLFASHFIQQEQMDI